jgi:hypothetical protein
MRSLYQKKAFHNLVTQCFDSVGNRVEGVLTWEKGQR